MLTPEKLKVLDEGDLIAVDVSVVALVALLPTQSKLKSAKDLD